MKKNIALTLGGSSIFGAAHIGVLRAFEEAEINISSIAATGLGSWVAALHAFGVSNNELVDLITKLHWLDIYEFTFSGLGELSNTKMKEAVERALGNKLLEEAQIPATLIAADIDNGRTIPLNTGNVAEAVMAATSIPGIFLPVEIEGKMLVDGSIAENIPLSPFDDRQYDSLVGVNLITNRQYAEPRNTIELLSNAFDMASSEAATQAERNLDYTIRPELMAHGDDDFSNIKAAIRSGYDAAVIVTNAINNQDK